MMTRNWSCILLCCALVIAGCSPSDEERDIEASGTIEATEVNVSAKTNGHVKKLLVDEGSAVNEGDTLAVIDHESLDLQLKQANAGVDLADAQLRLLLNGARSEDIAQAEEAVRQSEANLRNAEADFARMRELFSQGSVTQKQRDDAEALYIVSQSRHNSAVEGLRKLQQFARPEEISAARARLNQAKAQSDLLKKTIADCYITAPMSGAVTHKAVEVGELVNNGSILLTVSKLDILKLVIYVSEQELGHVRLGQEAEVKIDTYPDHFFKGKVTYVSPTAEFTPKNVQTKEDRTKLVFAVKIEVENPEGKLKSGMPADAVLKAVHETKK
jgi:HlyD family secretion protein